MFFCSFGISKRSHFHFLKDENSFDFKIFYLFFNKDLNYLKTSRNRKDEENNWPEIISQENLPNSWPQIVKNTDKYDPVKVYRNIEDILPTDDDKIPYETLLDDKNLNTDDKIKLIDLIDSQKDNNEDLEMLFEINDQKSVETVPRYHHDHQNHNFQRNIQKRYLNYDDENLFEENIESEKENSIENIW